MYILPPPPYTSFTTVRSSRRCPRNKKKYIKTHSFHNHKLCEHFASTLKTDPSRTHKAELKTFPFKRHEHIDLKTLVSEGVFCIRKIGKFLLTMTSEPDLGFININIKTNINLFYSTRLHTPPHPHYFSSLLEMGALGFFKFCSFIVHIQPISLLFFNRSKKLDFIHS